MKAICGTNKWTTRVALALWVVCVLWKLVGGALLQPPSSLHATQVSLHDALNVTVQLNLMVPEALQQLALQALNISMLQLEVPHKCSQDSCDIHALHYHIHRNFSKLNYDIQLHDNALETSSGIVGPFYSSNSIRVSNEIATPLALPMISYGSTATQLSSAMHPFFSRVVASNDLQAEAMVDMFFRFSWRTQVAILASDDVYGSSGKMALERQAALYGFSVLHSDFITEQNAEQTLQTLKDKGCRYILAFVVDTSAQLLLTTAQKLHMLNGDHVFLFSENFADAIEINNHEATFSDPSMPPHLLHGLLFIQSTTGYWKRDTFLRQQWDKQYGRDQDLPQIAPYLNDAFFALIHAVDDLLSRNAVMLTSLLEDGGEIADVQDAALNLVRNGTLLMDTILSQDFLGATGRIIFNPHTGDRSYAPYTLLNIDTENHVSQITRWEVGRLFQVDKTEVVFPGDIHAEILISDNLQEIIGSTLQFFPVPDSGTPPADRFGASVSFHYKDSQMLLFGGRRHVETRFSDFWLYDMKQSLWRQVFSFRSPSARSEHVSFVWRSTQTDEYFYSIFGGFNGKAVLNEQWNYRFSINSWTQSKDENVPVTARLRSRVVQLNQRTYMVGGEGILQDNNDVWYFDHHTEMWNEVPVSNSESIFAPRRDHCLTMYNSQLFVYAGRSHEVPFGMSDTLMMDPLAPTRKWSLITTHNTPIGRYAPVCETWEDNIYIGLGFSFQDGSPGEPYSDFYRINMTQLQNSPPFLTFHKITSPMPRNWEGRDHVDTISFEGQIVFFGGWAAKSVVNDLVRFNMETETLEVVHESQKTPPNVHLHSEVVVANQLYVYGGQYLHIGQSSDSTTTTTGGSNDMYRLNLDTFEWQRLVSTGTQPQPTQGSAAAAFADIIFIHGGVGASGYSNQFHEYSIVDNRWNELEFGAFDATPSARAFHTASFVEVSQIGKRSIYFFGGVVMDASLSDVWEYKVDEFAFREVTAQETDVPIPRALAHCQSAVLNGKILIYGGEDDAVTPNGFVYSFDPVTEEFSHFAAIPPEYQTSRNSIAATDEALYIYGGSSYDDLVDFLLEVRNGYVRRIETGSSNLRPEKRADHSLQFFKSYLLIFGGIGSIPSKRLQSDITIYNNLFEYRLDVCVDSFNHSSCVNCSPGSRRERDRCVSCDRGYYQNAFGSTSCLPCPKGSYSPFTGSSSPKLCLPCKPNTYQDQEGSFECIPCDPTTDYCPIGSTQIYSKNMQKLQDGTYSVQSYQPKGHQENAAKVQSSVQISIIVTSSVVVFYVLVFSLGWWWLRKCFFMFDFFFNEKHNYRIGTMKRKKTVSGGFLSLLLCLLWIAVAFNIIYPYFADNISDRQSLSPVLGDSTRTNMLSASLNFTGPPDIRCIAGEERVFGKWQPCHRSIQVGHTDIDFSGSSEISCKLEKDDTTELPVCFVMAKYYDFTVKSSLVEIEMVVNEENSFSSRFGWNVTTTSGYPVQKLEESISPVQQEVCMDTRKSRNDGSKLDEICSVASGVKYSSQDSLFRGKQEPTKMRIKYIQTLFSSDSKEQKGAHVENRFLEAGSYVDSSSFSSRNGFQFHFVLEVAENYLRVERTQRISRLTLFSELGGATSLLFTGTLLLLRLYEAGQSLFLNSNIVRNSELLQRIFKFQRVKDRLEIVDEVKSRAEEKRKSRRGIGKNTSLYNTELAETFLKLEDEEDEEGISPDPDVAV